MKSAVFLGVVLLLPGFLVATPESCTLSDILSQSSLMKSLASAILEQSKEDCKEVTERGAYATCPADYTPYACACGMGCGSWDIQNGNRCHCQCAGIDWTNAHCCRQVAKSGSGSC